MTTPHRGGNPALDLDALERLARGATSGPWHVETYPHTGDDVHVNNGSEMGHVASFPLGLGFNAEFIAAADPDTVLELISLARDGLEAHASGYPVGAEQVEERYPGAPKGSCGVFIPDESVGSVCNMEPGHEGGHDVVPRANPRHYAAVASPLGEEAE